MEIKNNELLILIGISFILSSLQINLFFNLMAMYIVCFVISYRCYKDIKTSLKYSVFLTIVFYILKIVLNFNNKIYIENSNKKTNMIKENFDELNDDSVELDNEKIKEDNENTIEKDIVNYKTDDKKENKEIIKDTKELIPEHSLNELQLSNDKNTLDSNEEESLNKYLSKLNNKDEIYDKNSDIKDMSPAHAQRELFRLIDTTSLLKKTMTEMTPVLNEGKKIMKSIEALNLIN